MCVCMRLIMCACLQIHTNSRQHFQVQALPHAHNAHKPTHTNEFMIFFPQIAFRLHTAGHFVNHFKIHSHPLFGSIKPTRVAQWD